jgi:hypothetical protein
MSNGIRTCDHLVIADTCSFLDLVRGFHRTPRGAEDLQAAIALQEFSAAEPTRLLIAKCSPSVNEFGRHFNDSVNEVRVHLERLDLQVRAAHEVSTCLSVGPLMFQNAAWANDLAETVADTGQNFFDSAELLDELQQDRDRADARVHQGIAPAQRGANSYVDCKIVECTLRVAADRVGASTFFLSSNTKDFGSSARPKPPLDVQFDGLGIRYLNSWYALRGQLRGHGYGLLL